MKAVRFHAHGGPDVLRFEDVPDPVPREGEALVRVRACALNHLDLWQRRGIDRVRIPLPHISGSDVSGIVEDSPAGTVPPGTRVMLYPGLGCRQCAECRAGRDNLCAAYDVLGYRSDGGYAEQAVIRADFAVRLPERFADLAAAPLLCGGVIGYRALRVSGIRPGERLGLYGFGASALLAIQVALHWGCQVFVATRSPAEQRRAREMGAEWAGSYEDPPPVPLDAAVTFAPAGDVVVAALRALDRGGVVAINAIHLDRIPEFPYDLLWWERQIRSVANFTRRDAQDFVDLAARIPIHTLAEPYPLTEANPALLRLKEGRVAGAAVLHAGR